MSADRQLDNPVWFALSETHEHLAIEYPGLKCYVPDYCPFGATNEVQDIASALNSYAELANDFFIVGNRPTLPDQLHLKKELVCAQMIVEHEVTINRPGTSSA